MYFLEKLKIELAEEVNKVLKADLVKAEDFEYPPEDVSKADFALPCFRLAPKLKDNPQNLAKKIAGAVKAKWLSAARNEGGYVNFYLERAVSVKEILNDKSLALVMGKGEKIMLEYVSPNSNKPLHLGHVRNGFLGEAMANILTAMGHKVKRTCLINDRGVAISKAMLAYKLWGRGDSPKKSGVKSDHFVGKYYVMFDKKAKENSKLVEDAQEMLRKYEAGDKETIALWKKITKWALDGYKETYAKLGVAFDKVSRESELYEEGRKLTENYLASEDFEKDEKGNIIAKLDDCKLPDKVMLRADGTAVYATTDLALAKQRIDSGYKKIYYVVGSEQELYFKQLFCILKKIGFSKDLDLRHLSYGMVVLPEGRMKSREGAVVDADDLVAKMEELAAQEIKLRSKGLSKFETLRRAKIIASAALKFYILNVRPETTIHFNPKESLSFTGKTGPYLLYSYARLHSIWRKGGMKISEKSLDFSLIKEDETWQMIFEAAKFPEALARAADELNPEKVAMHLYFLANKVSSFYHKVPVLEASLPERKLRIAIIASVLGILKTGFLLLGIEALEEM